MQLRGFQRLLPRNLLYEGVRDIGQKTDELGVL